MTTATRNELLELGFQKLRAGKGWREEQGLERNKSRKGLGEYLGLIKQGVAILAKKIGRNRYQIQEARDAHHTAYTPEAIAERFGEVTVPNLLTKLQQPRWLDVKPETKDLLYRIAQTPQDEDPNTLIKRAFEDISTYEDPIKNNLSIEFEAAITAWQTATPERYLDQLRDLNQP